MVVRASNGPGEPRTIDGYIRVSTKEQARMLRKGPRAREDLDRGAGLNVQESKIRAYADVYNLRLAEVLSDEGFSGKSLERPGIQRGLERLRTGQVDGLVIYKLDRLTRSVRDFGDLLEDYFGERSKPKASLHSVQEQFSTATANGRLFVNLIIQISQWERETISERTSEGLADMRQGFLRTGSIPYGWHLSEDDPRRSKSSDGKSPVALVPNPKEQRVIRFMQDLRRQAFTFDRIAWRLNGLSIPSKTGKRWSKQVVRKVLNRAEEVPCPAELLPPPPAGLHVVDLLFPTSCG